MTKGMILVVLLTVLFAALATAVWISVWISQKPGFLTAEWSRSIVRERWFIGTCLVLALSSGMAAACCDHWLFEDGPQLLRWIGRTNLLVSSMSGLGMAVFACYVCRTTLPRSSSLPSEVRRKHAHNAGREEGTHPSRGGKSEF